MQTLDTGEAAQLGLESSEVPEGFWHFRVQLLLYELLEHTFSSIATVGAEQFVYWNPTDLRECLAPDVFVRFGPPSEMSLSWKIWERGAPHVAIEVISDPNKAAWEKKLDGYRRMGVSELVWFNPDRPEWPLRIWDFVGDGLLERRLINPCAQSRHLGGYWLPVDVPGKGISLRLSHNEGGTRLFLTSDEANALRAESAERELLEIKKLLPPSSEVP